MDDFDLNLLTSRRADAEQVDGDLKFLETLGNPGGETPAAEAMQPKAKKAKASKPDLLSADNPPDHEQFIGDRQTVGGTEYLKHKKTGVITDSNTGRATTDPAILSAFGQDAPTKLGEKTATAFDELDALTAEVDHPGVLKTIMDKGGAIGADIAEGLTEAPEQIPGGISDAISAMVGIGDMLQEVMPLPGFRLWDLEGNWAPAFGSAEDVTADLNTRKKTNQPFLPSISPKADTVTGGMINGMAQFLAGFADSQSFKAQVEFMGPVIGVWPGQSAGECLGSMLPNGAMFAATGGSDLEPGCLVAIADSAGVFHGKIFLGRRETENGPCYLAAQINPPMVRFYAENEIVAMHRIWFRIDSDLEPRELDLRPIEAFDYLFKPLHGSKCGAVNPDWRPHECTETPPTPERIH